MNFSNTGTKIFHLGTANGYSPVTMDALAGNFPTTTPVVISATQGAAPGVTGSNVLQRYWTLSNGDISSAGLTFQYHVTDVIGTEIAYSLSRRDPISGIWEIIGGSIDGINHTAQISGVSPSSSWTLGEPAALPIQLNVFTGRITETGYLQLAWSTISEVNNLGFYVQRRMENDRSFSTISNLIPAAGSSLENHQYTWIDSSVTIGGGGVYRLKQVDLNNRATYSNEIVISGVMGVEEETAPRAFQLLQNYPNPFNPTTVIKFSVETAEFVSVKIFTMLGEEVARLYDGMAEPGRYYKLTFNAKRLGSGIYLYKFVSNSHVAVKKMLLLK